MSDAALDSATGRAAGAFADLKSALADLRTPEDWDPYFEVFHDVLDWAIKEAGHLGDRHGGYIVVLDRGIKDEDTATMIRFLLNIRGVIAVDPVPDNAGMHIAERRALYRMRDAIQEAIFP